MATHTSAEQSDVSTTSPFETGRHAELMPTGKDYRLTGKMPAAEPAEDSEKDKDDTKGKPDAGEQTADEHTPGDEDDAGGEHRASSHDASSQREKPGKGGEQERTPENRFQKLSRRNRELELENARLKGLQEGRDATRGTHDSSRETRSDARPGNESTDKASKPAPRPRIDDIDPKTNKPKYANMQEYEDDVDKWHDERTSSTARTEIEKSDKQRAMTEAERVIDAEVDRRAKAARKEYPDYDETMSAVFARKDEHDRPEFWYKKGDHLDGFFLDSERGHDLFYYLGKNWDKHKAIFARDAKGNFLMNPVRQVRELAKIELALPAKGKPGAAAAGGDKTTKPSNSSAQRPSQAPRPPNQTDGTGAVTKEATEQAVEDKDQETYRRSANEKDPRLKAWRASQGKK